MSYLFQAAVEKIGPKGKPVQRHVLGVLAHIADDWGFVVMEVATIADKTQYNEKTVRRTLADLERDRWLRVERKVVDGKGNVYTLNGPKLGVAPSEKSKRSPLWENVIRLSRALNNSQGRVTSDNGVLKFEKFPDSKGKIESGVLFGEESSQGTESGDFSPISSQEGEETVDSDSFGSESVENAGFEDEKDEESPDSVSDSPDSVSDSPDSQSHAFNVFNNSLQLTHNLRTPLPPASGGGEISQISADAETKGSGETLVGMLLGESHGNGESKNLPDEGQLRFAAQRAMLAHGFAPDRRMEEQIAAAFGLWCEQTGHTPDEAVAFEEKNFRTWLEDANLMIHNWGWRWWFKQGYWAKPSQWPYDKQKLKEIRGRREASVGASYSDHDPEAWKRAEAERIREHLERAASAIGELGVDPAAVERLGEIAEEVDRELNLERLDRELVELEQKLFAGLLASASEAELAQLREQGARSLRPWQGRMQAEQIEEVQRQFLQKRLFEARGLPRLSLFYMPPAKAHNGDSRADEEGGE